jgi:hypothetical protein
MSDNRKASVALAIKIAKDLQDDKLTMGNFETWSDTIKAILEDTTCGTGNNSVWETVFEAADGSDPTPPQDASEANKKRHKQGAAFAQQLISRTIDAANKSQARGRTPRELWTHLQHVHRSSAPVNLDNIEAKMQRTTLREFKNKTKDEEQAMMMYSMWARWLTCANGTLLQEERCRSPPCTTRSCATYQRSTTTTKINSTRARENLPLRG